MKKKLLLSIVITSVCLFLSGPVFAAAVSTSDLWDVSQGTIVTGHSDMHPISVPTNMFGGSIYDPMYNEGDNTLFRDNLYAGDTHWIEWQTTGAVLVNSFNLVATHDPVNISYRAISAFFLYAWNGSTWDLLYSNDQISNPYGGGETYTDGNVLEINAVFSAVTAQNFRAEFVQFSSDGYGTACGPRINELDGYYIEGASVPVPGSLLLLGAGLAGVAGLRRRQ